MAFRWPPKEIARFKVIIVRLITREFHNGTVIPVRGVAVYRPPTFLAFLIAEQSFEGKVFVARKLDESIS